MEAAGIRARWYRRILMVYVLYLFILTLNPYDFSSSYLIRLSEYDTLSLVKFLVHFNIWDVALNIILFVPFGILLCLVRQEKQTRNAHSYFSMALSAFSMSLFIEIIQLFLDRSTSVIDLASNTTGAFAGMWLVLRHRTVIFSSIRHFSIEISRLKRYIFALLALLFLFTTAVLPWFLNTASGWNSRFCMIAGNESTGDRPWQGYLYRAAIYNRALSQDQIRQLYEADITVSESLFETMKQNGCVMLYDFSEYDGTKVQEKIFKSAGMTLSGNGVIKSGRGVAVTDGGMLVSKLPAMSVTQAVKRTDQLTVEVWMKPENLNQEGPARIVTISSGPDKRNVTLAQQHDGIHLRVRTMLAGDNGSRINLRGRRVLEDTSMYHIAATFNRGVERLAVNGVFVNRNVYGDLDYIPFILRMGTNTISKAAYFILFVVPMGILFYSLKGPAPRANCAASILLFIAAVQVFYCCIAGQPVNWTFFAAGLAAFVFSIMCTEIIRKSFKARCFFEKD